MEERTVKPAIEVRDLRSFEDLSKVQSVEREVWGLSDRDVVPLTLTIATKAAGSLWLGAFDGKELVGFAFAFPAIENEHIFLHSHMLAVRAPYRDLDLGFQLKLAQRERALSMHIREMTWTFDPLQARNAHLNFSKLGVISQRYIPDFYGPETSSILHRNGTDRLWVRWLLNSRRVQDRVHGKSTRTDVLELLSRLQPLVSFNGDGRPACRDLAESIARQRVAIEVPSDIGALEQKDAGLARAWREATRWAFTSALKEGFLVAEFCRTVRGQQGPGVYVLEKESVEDHFVDL